MFPEKKDLLKVAIAAATLSLIGCGSSSSSDLRLVDDPGPAAPVAPVTFGFSQVPLEAETQMREIADRVMPQELYDLLLTQLVHGDSAASYLRFQHWLEENNEPVRLCGVGTFGDTKPQPGFTVDQSNGYFAGDLVEPAAIALGDNRSLFLQRILVSFDNCALPDAADDTVVAATVTGSVTLERSWIGESNVSELNIALDNLSLIARANSSSSQGLVLTLPDGSAYNIDGRFAEMRLFDEVSQTQQNNLNGATLGPGELYRDLVRSRLNDNNFEALYAFDAPNLRVIHTDADDNSEQTHSTNLAAIFVADRLGDTPSNRYRVYMESPYRGGEEQPSIAFGSDNLPEVLFLDTPEPISGAFLGGNERDLLRNRRGIAFMACADSHSLGYSATHESPLIAGLDFINTDTTINTVRVYVDEDNTAPGRDISVFTTSSEDIDCSADNAGPSRYLPLPGLGGITYGPAI